MSLEETELKVGQVKLKGVYIAMLFTIVSGISGTIWTASSLYGRLEGLEESKISRSAITPLEENLKLVEQQLEDNDISSLQGKLAELGANLQAILGQQVELLALKERVVDVEKQIADMKATVQSAELVVEKVNDFDETLSETDSKFPKINREIDDIWKAMDDLANPLQ